MGEVTTKITTSAGKCFAEMVFEAICALSSMCKSLQPTLRPLKRIHGRDATSAPPCGDLIRKIGFPFLLQRVAPIFIGSFGTFTWTQAFLSRAREIHLPYVGIMKLGSSVRHSTRKNALVGSFLVVAMLLLNLFCPEIDQKNVHNLVFLAFVFLRWFEFLATNLFCTVPLPRC